MHVPNVASTICPNFHWHAIWWYIRKKASSYVKIVGSRLGARTTWKGTKVQITKFQKDLHAEIVQKYLYTKRTCCTIYVKGYAQSHTFWYINLTQKSLRRGRSLCWKAIHPHVSRLATIRRKRDKNPFIFWKLDCGTTSVWSLINICAI